MAQPTVRPTELLTAVSLAVDLGLGQPAGHVARAAVAAARLNDRLPEPTDRSALFDIALTGWIGCIADSRDAARWFGDDIEYRAGVYDLDMKPLPFLGYLLQHAGAGDPPPVRAGKKAAVLLDAGRGVRDSLRAHCQVTADVARRLGMPELVCTALAQIFTRWDGKGLPAGVGGTDISLPVRIWQLTDVVEVHHRRGGAEAAREVCRARSGGQFDPALVDACLTDVDGLFDGTGDTGWEEVLVRERGAGPSLPSAQLDAALGALGDWADLKSAWFTGHSAAVATLAGDAAGCLGLAEDEVVRIRRAGYVHDLGRIGVPNSVLDKRTPLAAAELERLRLQPYYTERILTRSAALKEIGELAAMAHERLDGSGHHRGLAGSAIPLGARVLAAADVYRTKREERPHRPAMEAVEAVAHLEAEVREGSLDARAAAAVIEAAGHPARAPVTPNGLTAREAEVLGLLARGLTNRQVARDLGITPKTVGNHVEHIYQKAGVSTRAAATLFAMEHGLVS